jgi:hypothetical protein
MISLPIRFAVEIDPDTLKADSQQCTRAELRPNQPLQLTASRARSLLLIVILCLALAAAERQSVSWTYKVCGYTSS